MDQINGPSLNDVFTAAVNKMWQDRDAQAKKGAGKDHGTRSEVTGGQHLNSVEDACSLLFQSAGADQAGIATKQKAPGYFAATKNWDIVYQNHPKVVLGEVRSMFGSVGKNFTNRTYEAIGAAEDMRCAAGNGLFGAHNYPFRLYCFVLGEDDETRRLLRPIRHAFAPDDAPLLSDAPALDAEIDAGEAQTYTDRFGQSFSRMLTEGYYEAIIFFAADRETGAVRQPFPELGVQAVEQRLRAYLAS